MAEMCTDGFHHVALKVPDFEATVRFYTEGLGFEKTGSWGEGDKRAMLLHAGRGNYVEVFAGGVAEEQPGAVLHLAFRTDDCDAAIEKARRAGAVVTVEPKDVVIPSSPKEIPVRLAFCKGPAGETIEFFQNATT